MSEKIALHRIANAVDLQSEVLCSLIMRVQMLEAQIEQMQRTTGRNRRRAFKVMYRSPYKVMP
jgi:hypothetical protein